MLTHTSSDSPDRRLNAARVRTVAEPYDAPHDVSWRLEALNACARACALGWCLIPPSLLFSRYGERGE